MRGHLSHDKTLKIFSPEGRLFQVEYAFKAVLSCGLTAVALKGSDCVVACVQKKIPDKLVDPSTVTSIHRVSDSIYCLLLGNVSDGQLLLSRLRYESNNFKYENGYDIPVHVLAGKISGLQQYISQIPSIRTLCTTTLLMSIDEEKGPQLFKLDPAGRFEGYKGCAAGAKEQEAMTLLEKIYKKKASALISADDASEGCIDTLQNVIGSDFKPGDLEVCGC